MDKDKQLRKGQKIASIAFWLEGSLVMAKVVIGLLSGSVALISDAVHSASDILSIITSWLGLKIAQKKADKRFAYGYYKAENLGTLVISIIIIYASWKMFTQGYERLFSFTTINIPIMALGISLLDAIILFFFGKYEIRVAKEIDAQSILAMGEENKTHIFTSTAVFIGTLAAYYKIPYVESIITVGISLLIFKIGVSAIKSAVFSLMDASPDKDIENQVIEAIESIPGVEEYFDLRLRKSGPFIFGDTKVGIRKYIDVRRAHEIADDIEKEIKSKVPQIDSFNVHVEPFKSDFHHLVIPVKEENELNSELSDEFGRSPYFLFVNLKGNEVIGHYFIRNTYKDRSVRAGLAVSKLIAKQKSEILITKEIGEVSMHALRDDLVDVYQAKGKLAKEIINNFSAGSLDQLKKATKERE